MIGSQIPRIRVEPPRVSTDGGDAAELMAAYASELDPWQRDIDNCWLGKDLSGAYVVSMAGLSVPRQNGKNVCLEGFELYLMTTLGVHIVHTAHQVRTSKKSFKRLKNIFLNRKHPELIKIVENVRYTNGEEAILLDNGASIEYLARSRQAARGFDDINVLVLDEAQELTDEQYDALVATLASSASGIRIIIMIGTPPYPGCPGTVFRRFRTACLTNPDPHAAWHEWGVDAQNVEEIPTDCRELWYMTNPGMGRRLTEDFTATELGSMTADGFARERLGWWSPVLLAQTDNAIPAEVWDACKSSELKPEGKTAYGVQFSADGSEVALCGAVIPPEGPARISLIERRPTALGTRWLAEWLRERYSVGCCVVIDGRNGVDLLIDRISDTWKAKGSVVRPRAGEVVAAASALVDALNEKSVTWYEQQEPLRDSAVSSVKRPIGGGWGFGGDDPCPIAACALALWGAKTSKRDPQRRMRIG